MGRRVVTAKSPAEKDDSTSAQREPQRAAELAVMTGGWVYRHGVPDDELDDLPVTHRLAPRLTEHTFPRLAFTVVDGPDRGRRVAADGAELAVGRAPGNQLVLSDVAVSEHHFAVTA